MKQLLRKGLTSKSLYIFVQDTRSGANAGLTGLAYNTSGLTGYYAREGATGGTSITLATSTLGTWTSGAFKEVDATNLPGVYEVGIPDAALASGADHVVVMYKGAANMAPVVLEIELAGIENPFQKGLAFNNFTFMMFGTNGDPQTGATVTAERSIDGGAFASCTNSVSEIGNGWYKINLSTTDLNATTNVALKFTATGCKQTNITIPMVK